MTTTIDCSFELNDKPMSALEFGARAFPAFSGIGKDKNRRASMCFLDMGPIPIGAYYIFDRQSGGTLGWFYDLFKGD